MTGFLIASAVAVIAMAQDEIPLTKVEWTRVDADFGAFDESLGKVTTRFGAVNKGNAPLVVVSVRANCGCTTPSYPKGAIAPGDTAWIEVTYDSAGRPGRFMKHVYVTTNTDPARTELTVRGVVLGKPATLASRYPVEVGPIRLERPTMLMGTVHKDHSKAVFLRAISDSQDTVSISIADTPKWLSVTATPNPVPPGENISLSFYGDASKTPLYGLITDTISLTATTAEGAATYRLPVTMNIDEDFSKISDKELAKAPAAEIGSNGRQSLGRVEAGKPLTAKYILRNNGKSPLLVRRVYSGDRGVSATVDRSKIAPGKTATITVTVDGAEVRPGLPVNVRAVVIVNDPLTPVHNLRLTAEPMQN